MAKVSVYNIEGKEVDTIELTMLYSVLKLMSTSYTWQL